MNSDNKLPLSAFMPNHPSLHPHAPFIATAGKKNDSSTRFIDKNEIVESLKTCLLYTSPSPRDRQKSRMPSSA